MSCTLFLTVIQLNLPCTLLVIVVLYLLCVTFMLSVFGLSLYGFPVFGYPKQYDPDNLPGGLKIACATASECSQIADTIRRTPATFRIGRAAGLGPVVSAHLWKKWRQKENILTFSKINLNASMGEFKCNVHCKMSNCIMMYAHPLIFYHLCHVTNYLS